jgi:hypothetical protein
MMASLKAKRLWKRTALAMVGMIGVALLLLNYTYGIAPSHWWLQDRSARVFVNGRLTPGLPVYHSLAGNSLVFVPVPKYGGKTPYYIDVHRKEVIVPSGDVAFALPGFALSRHGSPSGVPMPQTGWNERQTATNLLNTAEFHPEASNARLLPAGVIDIPSRLIIQPHRIEFNTAMGLSIRIMW